MLVSLQADYALRVLVDVAVNQAKGTAVVTREIAERQHVPRVFLTKIVAQLAAHGMLRTQRGKGGGVTLGKAPEKINILDVIEAFEGDLQFNQCAHDPHCCTLSAGCTIRPFWRKAEAHLKDFFKQRSLADIMHVLKTSRHHHEEHALVTELDDQTTMRELSASAGEAV